MNPIKRIAIIGAGPSGLTAAKSAFECGLEPTVFEQSEDLGGVWKGRGAHAWEGMKTNISRHSCCFSDYPWKSSAPLFPNQAEVRTYLGAYARHFRISDRIRLGAEVVGLGRRDSIWEIRWRENGREHAARYEFVVVASGFFARPFIPRVRGLDSFRGTVLHSHDYWTPEDFEGKRLLVVGGAFSGLEIAAELSPVCREVVTLVRRPCWILPRLVPQGSSKVPVDFALFRRGDSGAMPDLTRKEKNRQSNQRLSDLALNPDERGHPLWVDKDSSQPPFVAISDGFVDAVSRREVLVRSGELTGLGPDSAAFFDGTEAKIDAVVFATGYRLELPFLSEPEKTCLAFDPSDSLQPTLLHRATFHPGLPGIAFVGLYRGPFFGIVELQARWATGVFSGNAPELDRLRAAAGLTEELAIRTERPRPQFPHGDYVNFADQIAKEICVLPSLSTDDPLNSRVQRGPVVPAHYRLSGFGANPRVARQTIAGLPGDS